MKWRDIETEQPKLGQHIYVWVKLSHRHKRRTVARWGMYELIGQKHQAHSCFDKYIRVSYRSWQHWIPASDFISPTQPPLTRGYKMNLNKLADTYGLTLTKGSHSPGQGTCVMEAVAWLAGEPHSDRPSCTSPIISRIMINWNDRLKTDDERKKWLGPLIVHVVGTNHAELEGQRAFICADYAVRQIAPIALRAAGKDNNAKKLEELPAIVDKQTALEGKSAAADYADYADAADYADYADAAAYAAYADAADYAAAAADYADAAAYAAYADALNHIMTDMVMDLCSCSNGMDADRDMLIKASKALAIA